MLALYAAGVFPANTKHAVYNVQLNSIADELVVPCAPVGSSPGRHMVGAWVVSWPFCRRLARSSHANSDEIGRRKIFLTRLSVCYVLPGKRDERSCPPRPA